MEHNEVIEGRAATGDGSQTEEPFERSKAELNRTAFDPEDYDRDEYLAHSRRLAECTDRLERFLSGDRRSRRLSRNATWLAG